MTNKFLRLPEVLNRTGLPRSTLYSRIADGDFPSPVRLGSRSRNVGFLEHEIDDWIKQQVVHTRSKAAKGGAL